jgi:hypothetical protein
MKKKELPQDRSALIHTTRELSYVVSEDGKYETALSSGWDVKTDALEHAWGEINRQIDEAKELVLSEKKSPIYFFMIKNIMTIKLLSSYTGFWTFNVKRHLNPSVFKNLDNKTLKKYADIFNITIDELKNFTT